jgi:hypothetical protein
LKIDDEHTKKKVIRTCKTLKPQGLLNTRVWTTIIIIKKQELAKQRNLQYLEENLKINNNRFGITNT